MAQIREYARSGGKVSYEVRIHIRAHPTLSKSFRERKDAKRWARETEAKILSGAKVSRLASKSSIAKVVEAYRRAHEGSISRGKGYALDSVSSPSSLGEYSVDTLSRGVIRNYILGMLKAEIPQPENKKRAHKLYDGDRKRTYSPGAVRKLFYALKTAVEWHSVEHGYALDNKFKDLPVPGAWTAPRERRLEVGEEQKLLDACKAMYKDPRGWVLLITTALETAMRAGELLGMRWDEINEQHRFIVIPKEREKTRRGRQVPLSKRMLETLQELRKRKRPQDERVFANFPESSVQLGRGFKRIVKRAGLPDLRFHDLRHEATSRFFERTDLQTLEIALITGHAELKTLQRYANLRPAILAMRLDGGIAPGKRIR